MVPEAGFEGRCPYLGLEDDPETWFAFSSDSNHCHRVSPTEPVARSYQTETCLSENFVQCPVFRAAEGWRGRLPRELHRSGGQRRHRRPTSRPDSGAGAASPASPSPSPSLTRASRQARTGRPVLVIGVAVVVVIALVGFSVFLALSVIGEGFEIPSPPIAQPAGLAALTPSPGARPTTSQPAVIADAPTLASTSRATSTSSLPTETLPVYSPTPEQTPTPTDTLTDPSGSDVDMTYIVQRGDNLYLIALRYGLTVDAIVRANNLSNPNLLHVGQSLVLPGVGSSTAEAGELPDEEATTTTHVVQRGENLFRIALRYGTTIDVLAAYNGLTDPRRIAVGQILIVPLTGGAAAQTAPAAGELPAVASRAGITVQIGEPVYASDGRVAEAAITVSNQRLTPAVAGGRYYIATNPDGNRRWITLLRAEHQEVPVPILGEPTPLWHAIVTLTDGTTFDAYAGCIYREQILAEGYEPSALGGPLHWTMTLEDGWFDCGNAYQVKPEDLVPGQVATVPLTVYIMHPRDDAPVTRSIQQIALELWRSDGVSLGIVATRDY